jgi:hypothetical protein
VQVTGKATARPTRVVCAAALVALAGACSKKSDHWDKNPTRRKSDAGLVGTSATATSSRRAAGPPGSLRFIAIGGGPTPENTEISLEQDIELVAETLPKPGSVLFAGGTGSLAVREMDPEQRGDSVLVALGELWSSRAGRRSHYRAVRLDAERATLENVEARLTSELAVGSTPILVYIAAHGDQGATARDDAVALWGGEALNVARFAELTEKTSRPLRLVATSCFSGGFAELVFARADERLGPAKGIRCGLFAGTWDRETSGCDANPDRRSQESYGVHFTQALAGKDRAGHPLPAEDVDFDHDGRIGLLDAHTRARIAAASLDVPTTTSERWVRAVERGSAPIDKKASPEEAAVVAVLGAALSLSDEQAVERRWADLGKRLDDLNRELDDADADLASKESALVARLLEKWPVLNDAFHPDFAEMFRRNRNSIREVLERSGEARARDDARQKADGIDAQIADIEVDEARVLRLRRAYETLHKASALLRRGGPAADRYRALLQCERSAP